MAGGKNLFALALVVCGVLNAEPSRYDPALFENRIPADQLTFLSPFAGRPAKELLRDKQFRKLLKSAVPDCIFHYGYDMSLSAALDLVMKDSPLPVRVRDGRYLSVLGHSGPYLAGSGFVWIDMQEGIALGGFYFHPTNGEPTPSVTVFSRQVKAESISFQQLPAEFAPDLRLWSAESRAPQISIRYFISSLNKKGLLEHDEDYCEAGPDGHVPQQNVCLEVSAEAADLDLTAAYYLDQTHHATNATAWMINGAYQADWVRLRESRCGALADAFRCRVAFTRERVHVVLARNSGLRPIRR